jgi:hypothetical protein
VSTAVRVGSLVATEATLGNEPQYVQLSDIGKSTCFLVVTCCGSLPEGGPVLDSKSWVNVEILRLWEIVRQQREPASFELA